MSRKLRIGLIAALLSVLAILVPLSMQVEDWSRDLTTNRATTSAEASDPWMRSSVLSASIGEVREAIIRFTAREGSWKLRDDTIIAETGGSLALVRTSKLFRFADDIDVSLRPVNTGTRVDVTSASRVGKGDLGQNPRNIRQLMQALREEFPVAQDPG